MGRLKNAGVAKDLFEVLLILALLRVVVAVIVDVVHTSIPRYLEVDVLLGWVEGGVGLSAVAVSRDAVALVPNVDVSRRLVVACHTLFVSQHTTVFLCGASRAHDLILSGNSIFSGATYRLANLARNVGHRCGY